MPVFNAFMKKAVAKYGGTDFKVPPGGFWVKIDRFTGQRLSDDATGDNVIREYFRDGTDPDWMAPVIVAGFGDNPVQLPWKADPNAGKARAVTTSTGKQKIIPKKADFGTLSSGGLY